MLESVLGYAISGLEGLLYVTLVSCTQGKRLSLSIALYLILANVIFFPMISLFGLPEGLSVVTNAVLPTLYTIIILSLLRSKIKQPVLTAIFNHLSLSIGQGIFYLLVTPFGVVNWMMGSNLRFSIVVVVMYVVLNALAYLFKGFITITYKRVSDLLRVVNRAEFTVILVFVAVLYAVMGVSVNHWYASLVTSDPYDAFIALLLMAFSTITVVLVFVAINSKKKLEFDLALQQNAMQASYKEVINEIKGFWHSYANVMQVVDHLVYDEDLSINQVRDSLKDYSQWHHKAQIKQKMDLVEVPHVVVGSVLANKYAMANDLGVAFDVVVSGEGSINCNMRDLTEILGVALDNAIQAASAAKGSVVVNIDFSDQGFKFLVNNTLVIEEGRILKTGQSHGIGLNRVSDLARKNKKLHISHGIQDDTYQFELVVS